MSAVLVDWLLLGVIIGTAVSVVVAGAFLVGRRAFPGPDSEPGPGPASDAPPQDGEGRRRAEIRRYLRTIGESFAEDHPVEGHTVEFYLPERDVAITFDARAFYGIEGSSTSAVLVEHELPGVHLGSRLPFETPALNLGGDVDGSETERRTGAETGRLLDRTDAAFAVLGLPATADEGEVRDAYREKVKAVHPDHGGDPDEFRQLQAAYSAARERAAAAD